LSRLIRVARRTREEFIARGLIRDFVPVWIVSLDVVHIINAWIDAQPTLPGIDPAVLDAVPYGLLVMPFREDVDVQVPGADYAAAAWENTAATGQMGTSRVAYVDPEGRVLDFTPKGDQRIHEAAKGQIATVVAFASTPFGTVTMHGRGGRVGGGGAARSVPVGIVHLRAPAQARYDHDPAGFVEWSCRWFVRGHTRHLADGREVPVSGYVKGPSDKPFRPRTYVVDR